ncbi:MAG: SUF system NifU family Fe-S cluster assembly protein [Bacilli bacterium]|nr:SUF system NifU family Fe-S cluster assembly protein [Bacilli bacterium]
MDNNLKRTIILENYEKPFHKGLTNDESYIKGNKNSQTCIDNFDIQLKVNNNIIEDIRFDGEACAIATSSMSISISKLIGKTIEEALNIIENYEKMINEEEYDKDLLEELIVYEDIYKQPSRKKCATLGIEGIKDLIKNAK